jgi:hypothetical protein
VPTLPAGSRRPLTNQELKEFEKSHSAACEWNKPLAACSRQWQKQCLILLKKMATQKKLSWPFNEPVDPVVLGKALQSLVTFFLLAPHKKPPYRQDRTFLCPHLPH